MQRQASRRHVQRTMAIARAHMLFAVSCSMESAPLSVAVPTLAMMTCDSYNHVTSLCLSNCQLQGVLLAAVSL
jgi:hypothetical protein